MNEKEMLMKQLRANAFPHNNGKVMQVKHWTQEKSRSVLMSSVQIYIDFA